MPTPLPRARRTAALALTLLLAACSMDSADPPPAEPSPSDPPASAAPQGDAPAGPTAVIGAVTWQTDYPGAVALAVAADKPLWVHFGEDPG